MNNSEICYKCGQTATSREHVPPLCFFPERKDTLNIDFRKNLITVPSCDEHNSKKSMDDEFLLAALTGIVGNNIVGYIHSRTKVKRAFERKGKHFIKTIFKNPKTFHVQTDNGKFSFIQGSPHFDRLVKCFEHISFGLFFKEFKNVFIGDCIVFLGFLKYKDENMEKMKIFIKKKYAIDSKEWKFKGENQSVFKYQFGVRDNVGLIPMKMTFYEGTEIFVAFKDKQTPTPFNLGMKLINSGIKTFMKISDDSDETIEFN